jgi:hypothetical protein
MVCDNYNFAKSTYPGVSLGNITDLNFSFYPNPAKEMINLEFTRQADYLVSVININGKKLIEKQITQDYRVAFPVNGFKPGLYSIRVLSLGTMKTVKLIILK